MSGPRGKSQKGNWRIRSFDVPKATSVVPERKQQPTTQKTAGWILNISLKIEDFYVPVFLGYRLGSKPKATIPQRQKPKPVPKWPEANSPKNGFYFFPI